MRYQPDQLNQSSSKDKQLQPISRIHFLIHPGFGSDPRVCELANEERLKQSEDMLGKYANQARQMQPDEVMFAYVHSKPPELRQDLKEGKPYTRSLRELKKILDKRLIVLSDRIDIFDGDQAINESRIIAQLRGFIFNPGVETVAYGETSYVCVPDAAINLNATANFQKPTKVLLGLTEASLNPRGITGTRQYLTNQFKVHEHLLVFEWVNH